MEPGTKSTQEQRFAAAVKVIQSLPSNGSFQPSNEMMLKFYSYYKQATQGPCCIPRPGFWDPVGKVKWDAWHALGDMPKDEAMIAYVEDLKLILESMPVTDQVEQLLHVIGPFYELVDERSKITHVSDLSTGFGSSVTAPSKAVTKSIIRNMQMNGTLDGHLAQRSENPMEEQEDGGDDGDSGDDEGENEEEEEELAHIKKAQAPEKKAPSGKVDSVPNGSVGQSAATVANGAHGSKSALNGKDWVENGGVTQTGASQNVSSHTRDDNNDVAPPPHVASDSDSEVYCDSVDQFGVDEQGCEPCVIHSLHESPSALSFLEETQPTGLDLDGLPGAQEGARRGGEDGKTGSGGAQRQGLGVGRPGSAVVRRGRGSRSPGPGSGATRPLHAGEGGEGWGPTGGMGGDLNEQIVTALSRLQEDMQSVLERLHTLEVLTASQARVSALPSEYLQAPANEPQKKYSWWPFHVAPTTVALAIVWPFIAQWLIRLYLRRQRRKPH
ncbi:acyl-CoA-binding domain-containing protein 5A isoform X1 [Electrophorus electricus]|uniref:acyl-CoA-binding domain-containing protein 5A isoform X1 n=1 Tax=Electrophorus electricus TaxID=8005 RepID=UPI0015D066E5|nr:acyl-CoA-binding domain-containing protein 5A isoform X1 [Electrophorus electricus]XP_035387056.1 acyl-CoA-binding domain-containing protein 5A isoform X1 [Electrophorus electricus]